MADPPHTHPSIRYYDSFEARETAFRSEVSGLVPSRHVGPRRFWHEFVEIGRRLAQAPPDSPGAVIPANPGDSLAYSTPRQELVAMQLRSDANGQDNHQSYKFVAGQYGLASLLDQPVRTLSGGETALLALAKAHMAARTVAGLTVASPFNWLSSNNRRHFTTLCRHYHDHGRTVSILALTGEDDMSPLGGRRAGALPEGRRLAFEMALKDLVITLGFALGTGRPPATAAFHDTTLQLRSPCLISGENGNGKSLLAKALCGAVPFGGLLRLKGRDNPSPPRLLFQDAVSQTLFRPFSQLATEPVRSLYRALRQGLPGDLAQQCRRTGHVHRQEPPSLLEVKLMLAAVRLQQRPGALAMDEPDWGLTRAAAVSFVDTTIGLCHDIGVPVLLISHKPWWDRLAASRVAVAKQPRDEDRPWRLGFRLRRGAP